MPAKPASLQDLFLNSARRSKSPLTLFLVKGVKLQGVITWFDTFSVLLRRDAQTQLVYKHSISTILPAAGVDLGNLPAPDNGEKSLQDIFLAAAARERREMTVFLVNGVMLQGTVAAHDQFSLLLERGRQIQLVYKHAVSTMQPEEPLNLGEGSTDEQLPE